MIEPTSYIWYKLLAENHVPKDGVVIEVAPGFEPKIGNALFLLGFSGAVYIVEPDLQAMHRIKKMYKKILPQARIFTIAKLLQEVKVGIDVPRFADALVASHPFDDMVMSATFNRITFFEEEKKSKARLTAPMKKLYDAVSEKDYLYGIQKTLGVWKNFITASHPSYFIASQYPSRTLEIKGLRERQKSGFAVLDQLKIFYRKFLKEQPLDKLFSYKSDPRWWISACFRQSGVNSVQWRRPSAIKRLGKNIFVAQKARWLRPEEYEIVYAEKQYEKTAHKFAIEICNQNSSKAALTVYADRQKDQTGIGLCGNLGSGRAVYFGDKFNILGCGRTSLCRSKKPSHSTGRAELIGCMRRLILSKWINVFTKRAVEHPVIIALNETRKFKWNARPIPLTLVVRVDEGDLDRPSHVEFSPEIPVNFKKIIKEYARLDAEFFAYRIMLGAWSTSNYSLNGKIIDLESASFVKYRGPYYTSTSKYLHNRFGCEGLGFLNILNQLAGVKKLNTEHIRKQFYKTRSQHLGFCFLKLLGVDEKYAKKFFLRHTNDVVEIASRFEQLAKPTKDRTIALNLYAGFLDKNDPSVFDMSKLFRNLVKVYKNPRAEKLALKYVTRKRSRDYNKLLKKEIQVFIHNLLKLLSMLETEKCLGEKSDWEWRLRFINQDLPSMFELNSILKELAEKYRLKKITAKKLGADVSKLCELPYKFS